MSRYKCLLFLIVSIAFGVDTGKQDSAVISEFGWTFNGGLAMPGLGYLLLNVPNVCICEWKKHLKYIGIEKKWFLNNPIRIENDHFILLILSFVN